MKAASIARYILSTPFALLPHRLNLGLLKLVLTAEAGRPSQEALRSLFEIDSSLAWHVNQAAVRYGKGLHVKHRLMNYHEFFVQRVRPGQRVLDIGCGNGAVAYSIATRTGATVVGIDNHPGRLSQARRDYSHPNLAFAHADALTSLPPGPFHVVVLSNVLEHIEHRIEFLSRIRGSIRPESCLVRVPMANRDWRIALREELGLPHYSDVTHFTEYTEEAFRSEMRASSLTVRHLQINWGEIWAEVG